MMTKYVFTKETGFTLVELVVVIAILGILSAFAIPRFVNLQTNAKIAVLNSIKGAVLSASHQVNLKAHLEGVASRRNATISFNGQTIRTRWGYPRTNQMFSTPGSTRLVDVTSDGARITRNIVRLDNNNNCRIRYRHPTALGQPPRIDMRTSGC